MHRCSSSEVGMCSCGLFHAQGNCFSMLFSMPNHKPINEMNTYPIASSSSSVDCTLSLGTPSTRQTDDRSVGDHHRSGLCMSWDIYQTKQSSSSATTTTHKSSRGSTSNNLTGDSLLARRCANCDTTSTPLWRNGPRGPKSLCNACGIRYKKEERRATTTTSNGSTNSTATIMDPQHMMNHHHHHSWGHHAQTQKEYRFMEDDNGDSNTTIPFLSWRLNVPDRPSLVHDFT